MYSEGAKWLPTDSVQKELEYVKVFGVYKVNQQNSYLKGVLDLTHCTRECHSKFYILSVPTSIEG